VLSKEGLYDGSSFPGTDEVTDCRMTVRADRRRRYQKSRTIQSATVTKTIGIMASPTLVAVVKPLFTFRAAPSMTVVNELGVLLPVSMAAVGWVGQLEAVGRIGELVGSDCIAPRNRSAAILCAGLMMCCCMRLSQRKVTFDIIYCVNR
jgi:hypothetical protein